MVGDPQQVVSAQSQQVVLPAAAMAPQQGMSTAGTQVVNGTQQGMGTQVVTHVVVPVHQGGDKIWKMPENGCCEMSCDCCCSFFVPCCFMAQISEKARSGVKDESCNSMTIANATGFFCCLGASLFGYAAYSLYQLAFAMSFLLYGSAMGAGSGGSGDAARNKLARKLQISQSSSNSASITSQMTLDEILYQLALIQMMFYASIVIQEIILRAMYLWWASKIGKELKIPGQPCCCGAKDDFNCIQFLLYWPNFYVFYGLARLAIIIGISADTYIPSGLLIIGAVIPSLQCCGITTIAKNVERIHPQHGEVGKPVIAMARRLSNGTVFQQYVPQMQPIQMMQQQPGNANPPAAVAVQAVPQTGVFVAQPGATTAGVQLTTVAPENGFVSGSGPVTDAPQSMDIQPKDSY